MKFLLGIFAAVACMATLSACNTVQGTLHGMGRDIQAVTPSTTTYHRPYYKKRMYTTTTTTTH